MSSKNQHSKICKKNANKSLLINSISDKKYDNQEIDKLIKHDLNGLHYINEITMLMTRVNKL